MPDLSTLAALGCNCREFDGMQSRRANLAEKARQIEAFTDDSVAAEQLKKIFVFQTFCTVTGQQSPDDILYSHRTTVSTVTFHRPKAEESRSQGERERIY